MTRGSVMAVRWPQGRGHEQQGARPAVIVQANEFLPLSTMVVAPTSRSAQASMFRPEIRIGGAPTRVLTEQIRAVDVTQLSEELARLSAEEQRAVDDAMLLVLGLT